MWLLVCLTPLGARQKNTRYAGMYWPQKVRQKKSNFWGQYKSVFIV